MYDVIIYQQMGVDYATTVMKSLLLVLLYDIFLLTLAVSFPCKLDVIQALGQLKRALEFVSRTKSSSNVFARKLPSLTAGRLD